MRCCEFKNISQVVDFQMLKLMATLNPYRGQSPFPRLFGSLENSMDDTSMIIYAAMWNDIQET
jgi:hypothetical protein